MMPRAEHNEETKGSRFITGAVLLAGSMVLGLAGLLVADPGSGLIHDEVH